MLKRFLKNSAVYGAASALTRGIQILLVPVYTRLLAPADYGSLDLIMVIAALAYPTVTLQVASGMGRYYAEAADRDERIQYVSTAFWVVISGASLVAFVALVGAGVLAQLLGIGDTSVMQVGLLSVAAGFVYTALQYQLRFEDRAFIHGLSTVTYTLLSTSIALTLIVKFDSGVVGVLYGQVIGYLIGAALCWPGVSNHIALRFDRIRLRRMLAYSTPLVLAGVFVVLAMLADRLVINSLLGRDPLGVYGIGARVASTIALVVAAFSMALEPLFLSRYKEPDAPHGLARLFRIYLLIVLPLVTGISVFGREIVHLFTTPPFYGASEVIPLLTFATVCGGLTVFTPGLTLAKKSRMIALIVAISAAANVGLNYLLIPRMGIRGAATATLITSAGMFLVNLVVTQQYYRVPHTWWRLALALTIVVGSTLGGLAIEVDGLVAVLVAKGAIVAMTVLMLGTSLLERRDWEILRDRWLRWRRNTAGSSTS